MKKLISYTCSRCGAALNIENTQEVFDCPFCGNEFNYADLHRKELLEDAKLSLHNMEFVAAKEKYDMVLSAQPQNFEALLGLVLCAGNFMSVESLRDIDTAIKYPLSSVSKALEDVKERAAADDVPYFENMLETVMLADKYKTELANKQAVLQNSDAGARKVLHIINDQENAEDRTVEVLFGDGTSDSAPMLVMAIALICSFAFMFAEPLILLGVPIFIVLIIAIAVLRRVINNKRKSAIREKLKTVHAQEAEANKSVNELKEYYTKSFSELRKRKINAPEEHKAPEYNPSAAIVPANASSVSGKTLTCATCAGALVFDNGRNIYRCDHCGVAYGSSLFAGDPVENAIRALRNNEYTEADQGFVLRLMLDPKDPGAHRGRILCAAHVTNFGKIRKPYKLTAMTAKRMRERIDAAIRNVAEQDRDYFMLISELIDTYEYEIERSNKRGAQKLEQQKIKRDMRVSQALYNAEGLFTTPFKDTQGVAEANTTLAEVSAELRECKERYDSSYMLDIIQKMEFERHYVEDQRNQ